MTLPVLLLFLAASTRVELVDEVYQIPAADWRYVEVTLKQQPVLVGCDFGVESRGSRVRVAVLSREDLERLRAGRPHSILAASGFGTSGTLRCQVPVPGEYAVLVDNRAPGSQPVGVHLRIFLDFGSGPEVRYLSRPRQLAVIVISFAVFFGIVTYSARKLLRAIKR